MAQITLHNQSFLQSHYLYLQATGSTGLDNTVQGFHLRWDLVNYLGKHHIPKGNLIDDYPTDIGFNRQGDFVKIYRAELDQFYSPVVDFGNAPSAIDETGNNRIWYYNNLSVNPQDPLAKTSVILRFTDTSLYDTVRNTINPATNTQAFINAYTGVVEVEPVNKLAFICRFVVQQGHSGQPIEAEAISKGEPHDADPLIISCRKTLDYVRNPQSAVITCENVKYFRFRKNDSHIERIRLQTYEDFIRGKNFDNAWQQIGEPDGYSLSLDDQTIQNRFEDLGQYTVHQNWPKFNNGDAVDRDNYYDRWFSGEGIKEGVESYLTHSMDDTRAHLFLPSNEQDSNRKISLSVLDSLKLMALDFHNARMLGLGYIDYMEVLDDSTAYIYLAEYYTEQNSNLQRVPQTPLVQHLYCSLPTTINDSRLPKQPDLGDVSYGLQVPTASGELVPMSEDNGYLKDEAARLINLHTSHELLYEHFKPGQFDDGPQFCMCEHTNLVFYGIEYKETNEAGWRDQEISFDPAYPGYNPGISGLQEVVPVVNKPNPVFMHKETEPGIHDYAVYGINWFSRISQLSEERSTDQTAFKNRQTLLPPSNLSAHFIQPESTPMLTTSDEQGSHLGDTRVLFQWNHVHIRNYQYADKVEFLFRLDSPLQVRGEIDSITENAADPDLLDIATQPIEMASRGLVGGQVPGIIPDFQGQANKFIDGIMTCNGNSYKIKNIDESGQYPVITVKALKDYTSVHHRANQFATFINKLQPGAGDRFIALENINDINNWEVLQKEVTLVQHSTHTENITLDGQQVTQHFGGIYEAANVEVIPDVYSREDFENGIIPEEDIGEEIPGSNSGMYKVDFDTFTLAAHPDSDIEWYGGTVRMPLDSGNPKKMLQVFKIEQLAGETLKLYIHDPEFASDLVSTGTGIMVNFHPGFRLYLEEETAPGAVFTKANIEPSGGEKTKTTWFSTRAKDTAETNFSNPAKPVQLHARKVNPPQQPGLPSGPLYATRPDFYGKASYTFDVPVTVTADRKPYAMQFLRANEKAVLSIFYKTATWQNILEQLPPREDDQYFTDRWNDLVNVVLDNNKFKVYPDDPPDGFFPNPDNDKYWYLTDPMDPTSKVYPFETAPDPGTILNEVKEAIASVFVPLTEQLVMYEQISDDNRQTSPDEPVIKDSFGDQLAPSDPEFNPAPMVRRFEDGGTHYVRFTDYKLDGAAKNFYFYNAREFSKEMERSNSSEVAGPIQLVNAAPPVAPKIQKVTTQLANPITAQVPAINFEIAVYPEVEKIVEIAVYRAITTTDALSLRTMDKVATIPYSDPLQDDFSDLTIPPYGEPLFYRLVAYREITNEEGNIELVPSKPSPLSEISIVDNTNPEPPEITYTSGTLTNGELPNVVLEWNKTVHNGTYYLYKMNDKCNWNKIHEVVSNNATIQVDLANTDLGTNTLEKEDDNGNEIYHRFKVDVENASGLLNLTDKPKII